MVKTPRHSELLLLDPDKAALFAELVAKTSRAKQSLLREAVDDLLIKHKVLKPKRKP